MKKTELLQALVSEISEFCNTNKVKQDISQALIELVENKLKSKRTIMPPKEEKDGTYYFCRFHQQYEIEHDMVLLKGKSKGYCKAAISVWNKRNAKIKKLESTITSKIMSGETTELKELTIQLSSLKEKLNDPDSFDYEKDWENFNKNKTTE